MERGWTKALPEAAMTRSVILRPGIRREAARQCRTAPSFNGPGTQRPRAEATAEHSVRCSRVLGGRVESNSAQQVVVVCMAAEERGEARPLELTTGSRPS